MQIDAISFLAPASEPSLLPLAQQAVPDGQFGAWFAEQLGSVNQQIVHADRGVQLLAAGGEANLHQVMIDLEQAKLSLQLMMQVRTKVLDAYQELMRMSL